MLTRLGLLLLLLSFGCESSQGVAPDASAFGADARALDAEIDAEIDAGAEAGLLTGELEGCHSQALGWSDCNDDSGGFPYCAASRFHDLPACRSQNDGHGVCRSDTCEVDCGGERCVGLETCGGCEGALCGIYDNLFMCQEGRWVEVGDFGWHEDALLPEPPEDAGVP